MGRGAEKEETTNARILKRLTATARAYVDAAAKEERASDRNAERRTKESADEWRSALTLANARRRDVAKVLVCIAEDERIAAAAIRGADKVEKWREGGAKYADDLLKRVGDEKKRRRKW